MPVTPNDSTTVMQRPWRRPELSWKKNVAIGETQEEAKINYMREHLDVIDVRGGPRRDHTLGWNIPGIMCRDGGVTTLFITKKVVARNQTSAWREYIDQLKERQNGKR